MPSADGVRASPAGEAAPGSQRSSSLKPEHSCQLVGALGGSTASPGRQAPARLTPGLGPRHGPPSARRRARSPRRWLDARRRAPPRSPESRSPAAAAVPAAKTPGDVSIVPVDHDLAPRRATPAATGEGVLTQRLHAEDDGVASTPLLRRRRAVAARASGSASVQGWKRTELTATSPRSATGISDVQQDPSQSPQTAHPAGGEGRAILDAAMSPARRPAARGAAASTATSPPPITTPRRPT